MLNEASWESRSDPLVRSHVVSGARMLFPSHETRVWPGRGSCSAGRGKRLVLGRGGGAGVAATREVLAARRRTQA